jgi:hypothetical protein
MSDVTWEDPEPSPHSANANRGKWLALLAPLIDHPKRWALIDEAEKVGTIARRAVNLRRRMVVIPRPDDRWEFTTRGTKLYARYMGEAD